MAMDANKIATTVFGIVFALALLPVAVDSVVDFATAYPEWATLIGLVTIALIFGVVKSAMKSA